ncbi:MAG: hypothetical protein QG553_763 [Patescibacteria group bacterium]|nr:hypothetical protein [Patescibacteria group bacterium]
MPNENPNDPYVTVSMLDMRLDQAFKKFEKSFEKSLVGQINDMFTNLIEHMDARFDRLERRVDGHDERIDFLEADFEVIEAQVKRHGLWQQHNDLTKQL